MQLYHILFENPKNRPWLYFLFENKLENIRSKLSGKPLELFNSVLALKPELPNKYWQWIAKNYVNDSNYSPGDIHDLLMKFDDIIKRGGLGLPSKDIYSNFYSNPDSLKRQLNSISGAISSTQARKEKKSDALTIYSDNRYAVIHPRSMESACYYGAETKWCISAKEQNFFQSYTDDGVNFAIIIDKNQTKENPMAKVAIALVNDPSTSEYLRNGYEIYDSTDTIRSIEDVWATYPSNVLNAINKFFGGNAGNVIPVAQEEEIENIRNVPPNQAGKALLSYLEELDYKLANKENEGNAKIIDFLKKTIVKFVNYATDLQLGQYIELFFTENIRNLADTTINYIKEIILKKLNQNLEGKTNIDSINYLIQNLRIPLWIISKYDLVEIPTDPLEASNIFQNSDNLNLIKLVMDKNRELFAKTLIGSDFDIFISPSAFNKLISTYKEAQDKFPGKEFFQLPDNIQHTLEFVASKSLYSDPKIYDWEDPIDRLYNMIKYNQLRQITNKKTNDRTIIFIP